MMPTEAMGMTGVPPPGMCPHCGAPMAGAAAPPNLMSTAGQPMPEGGGDQAMLAQMLMQALQGSGAAMPGAMPGGSY